MQAYLNLSSIKENLNKEIELFEVHLKKLSNDYTQVI